MNNSGLIIHGILIFAMENWILFQHTRTRSDLFRSLSDDPTIQPQDISFVTLENAIYLNRKNDFAFTSQGKVLIIDEHFL